MNKKITTKDVQHLEETTKKVATKDKEYDEFDMPEFEKDSSLSQYEDVYFIKIVAKDAAYFEVTKKVGDKYVVNPRTDVNSLGGELIKIETSSYQYQGDDKKLIKLHIVRIIGDKKYLYIISTSYTQIGRTIVNCILDHSSKIEKIHLTLLATNKDGKIYANAQVSINGIQCKWKDNHSGPGKYTREEMSKYTTPITHPKTGVVLSIDYNELIDFLETELINHIPVVVPEQQDVRRFVPESEKENPILKDEATFGSVDDIDEDASDFFDIDTED